MSDQSSKTPLLELARSVPIDLRAEWETQWYEDGTPIGHAMAPVGRYIHELVAEIERLQDEIINLEALAKDRYCTMQTEIERLEEKLEKQKRLTKTALRVPFMRSTPKGWEYIPEDDDG